jgi:hypothetical protein
VEGHTTSATTSSIVVTFDKISVRQALTIVNGDLTAERAILCVRRVGEAARRGKGGEGSMLNGSVVVSWCVHGLAEGVVLVVDSFLDQFEGVPTAVVRHAVVCCGAFLSLPNTSPFLPSLPSFTHHPCLPTQPLNLHLTRPACPPACLLICLRASS